jgi:hypothetical protein
VPRRRGQAGRKADDDGEDHGADREFDGRREKLDEFCENRLVGDEGAAEIAG